MSDEMLTFRVDVEIENPAKPGALHRLTSVLVDTGAELSWVPTRVLESLGVKRNAIWHFRQADGSILESWSGSAIVHVANRKAADEVIFMVAGLPMRVK